MQISTRFNFKAKDVKAGFRHFDLGLTQRQLDVFEKVIVGAGATYDNFGDAEKITQDATALFQGLGNSPEAAREQAEIVAAVVKKTIAGFGAEAAWVTIRAMPPTSAFDIPRWHTDGYFFEKTAQEQIKAVITLKGGSTLLNTLPPDKRVEFMSVQRENLEEMESRQKRAAMIDASKTQRTPIGSGTVFIVGSDNATIHSEPPIQSERLFLSVLPGTKAQIEDLRQRWGRAHKTEIKMPRQEKPPAP